MVTLSGSSSGGGVSLVLGDVGVLSERGPWGISGDGYILCILTGVSKDSSCTRINILNMENDCVKINLNTFVGSYNKKKKDHAVNT